MKVLHVINRMIAGGAEKLILDTLPLMNEHFQTDVLLLQKTNSAFEKVLTTSLPDALKFSSYNSLYNPLHILKIYKLAKAYDVVHVHLFPSQYYVVLAKILALGNMKVVVTEHNTTNNRMRIPVFSYIDAFTYHAFNTTVCISEEIKGIMKRYTRLKDEKFAVIENGVNLKKIEQAKHYKKSSLAGLLETDIVVLQVSAFRKGKDQPALIKALQHLPKYVKAVFAGEGVMLDNCRKLALELGLEDRVLFLGMRMDIPELLKTADIIVLSSHYEGLSLASIEGMASGKPFVASRVPGLTPVVENAGVLFECGNDKELASVIQKLTEDKIYRQQVVTSCLARAKQYSVERMVKSQIDLYERI